MRAAAQAASGRRAAQPTVQPDRGFSQRPDPWLQALAGPRPGRLVAGAGGAAAGPAGLPAAVRRLEGRAGADRRHQHHHRRVQRPGRRHHRLHRALCAADRGGLREHPGDQSLHGDRRFPHGGPGYFLHEAGRLGRPLAQPIRDSQRAAAQAAGYRRRARLSGQPAAAGAECAQPAGQLRDPLLDGICRAAGLRRSAVGRPA
ncbi:hypothetical protein FQZ97_893730 [compost metagenome]